MSKLFGLSNTMSFMGSFWSFLDNFLVSVVAYIGDILVTLIFTIFKFVLNIVDIMQILLEKLVGLDYWGTDKVSADTLTESDVIFKFIMNDGVQRAFRWMLVVFAILIIVFTVIAIVKSEYDTVTTGDAKKSPKMPIFVNSLKTVLMVILIPLMLILGILSSNAILTSLVNALNVNNDLTIGSQIFTVSAYSANRYRVFADEDKRYAGSNRVTVTWEKSEDWDNDGTKEEKTFSAQVESYLPVVDPDEYGIFNLFNGFKFTLNGKTYLLEVDRNVDSPIYYPNYDGIGDTSFWTNDSYSDDEFSSRYQFKKDAYEAYLKSIGAVADDISFYGNVWLNSLHAGEELIEAAYNTWDFNDSYDEGATFENTIVGNNGKQFTAINGYSHSGVSYPRNTEIWGKNFDGGTGGAVSTSDESTNINTAFVPNRDEYYVMADVIDFMASEGATLNVVNATDTRIRWKDLSLYGYESDDLHENWIRGRLLGSDEINNGSSHYYDLLANYSISGKVAYTPNYNSYREDTGSIYIMCYRLTDGTYVPLLHNQKFTTAQGKSYVFSSDYYAAGYSGAVIARGLPYGSWGNSIGAPTIISDAFVNEREGIVVEGDEAHYAEINSEFSTTGELTYQDFASTTGTVSANDRYYSVFYKTLDYNIEINEKWFNKIDGAYYLKYYNAFLGDTSGDATNSPLDNIGEIKADDSSTWGNGGIGGFNVVKSRIANSLPKSFKVRNGAIVTQYNNIDWTYQEPLNINGHDYAVFDGGSNYLAYVDMQELINGKFIYFIGYNNVNNRIPEEDVPVFASETSVPTGFTGEYILLSDVTYANNTCTLLEVNDAYSNIRAFDSSTLTFPQRDSLTGNTGISFGFSYNVQHVFLNFDYKIDTGAEQGDGSVTDDRHGILKECSSGQFETDPDISLNYSNVTVSKSGNNTIVEFKKTNIIGRLHFEYNKLVKIEACDKFKVLMFSVDSDGSSDNNYSIKFESSEFTSDDFSIVNGSVYSIEINNQTYYSYLFPEYSSSSAINYKTYESTRHTSTNIPKSKIKEFYDLSKNEDAEGSYPFYDTMTYININTDGAFTFRYDNEKYVYDPELNIYFDNTKVYKFQEATATTSAQMVENTEISYTQAMLDKYNGVSTEKWLISKDQIKINEISYVGLESKDVDGVVSYYDIYSVELLVYNGKRADITSSQSDATYLGRIYSRIKILRDPAENNKQIVFTKNTHINADIMQALINNSYSYILDGTAYDRLPSYNSSVDIAQVFQGFGSHIYFNAYGLKNSGFLGIKVDAHFGGLINGGIRLHFGGGVKDQPKLLNDYTFHLANGEMSINYNMATMQIGVNNKLTFNSVYVPHKFNFIVFVFAAIMIFSLIFNAVWGLITRIYEITMYFIVMPGVAATTPLTPTMFKNWKDNLIKKVLGAYGVILGLNIFFLLIPPIKEASQIFKASDFDNLYVDFIPGPYKAKYINLIIYLMFLLVALSMIKTLPGLIANIMNNGNEEVYKKGGDTKKAVKEMTKDVGETISGKKALSMYEAVAGKMDPKTGKREGGWRNFVPGSAVVADYKNRRKIKEDLQKQDTDARRKQLEAFNSAKADEKQADLDKKLKEGFSPISEDAKPKDEKATTDKAKDVVTETTDENVTNTEDARETSEAPVNPEDKAAETPDQTFTTDQIYNALSVDDKNAYDALNNQETQLNNYLNELNDPNRAEQEGDEANIAETEKKLEQIKKDKEALENKAITELNNQSAAAAANAAQNATNTQDDTSAQEAAFYAGMAKDYADLAKERADIAAGRLKEYTDEEMGIGGGKKTRLQKKLDKANEQEAKDQNRLDKGKGLRGIVFATDKANDQFNEKVADSDPSKIVMDKNSKVVQKQIKEMLNKESDDLIKKSKPQIDKRIEEMMRKGSDGKFENTSLLQSAILAYNSTVAPDKQIKNLNDKNVTEAARYYAEQEIKAQNSVVDKNDPGYRQAVVAYYNSIQKDESLRVVDVHGRGENFDIAEQAYQAHQDTLMEDGFNRMREKMIIDQWNSKQEDDSTKISADMDIEARSGLFAQAWEDFNQNQAANRSEARSAYILNKHANKVEKLTEKVSNQKERMAERAEKREKWNNKSGLGKFLTVATLPVSGAVKLTGKAFSKLILGKKSDKTREKEILARDDAKAKYEQIADRNNRFKAKDDRTIEVDLNREDPKLLQKYINRFNKEKHPSKTDGNTVQWHHLTSESKAKYIRKYMAEEEAKAKKKLDNAESKLQYRTQGVLPKVSHLTGYGAKYMVRKASGFMSKVAQSKTMKKVGGGVKKVGSFVAKPFTFVGGKIGELGKAVGDKVSNIPSYVRKKKIKYHKSKAKRYKTYANVDKEYAEKYKENADSSEYKSVENIWRKSQRRLEKSYVKHTRKSNAHRAKQHAVELKEKHKEEDYNEMMRYKASANYNKKALKSKVYKSKSGKSASQAVGMDGKNVKVDNTVLNDYKYKTIGVKRFVVFKTPAVKEEMKKRFNAMAGGVSAVYTDARIRGRDSFINKVIRKENANSELRQIDVNKLQDKFKAQLSTLLKSGALGITAEEIKNLKLDGDLSKKSMKSIMDAVAEIKKSKNNELKTIEEKMKKNLATDTELKTASQLKIALRRLDKMGTGMIKTATKRKIETDEVTGDKPVTVKSRRDRKESIPTHMKLSDADLAKVASIAKSYVSNMNKFANKYGASKSTSSNDAYSRSKDIQNLIQDAISKELAKGMSAETATKVEELRQDLAKVKRLTTDMQRDIKRVNTNLSPVEAMNHATKKTKK